jgi:hypothetical protein
MTSVLADGPIELTMLANSCSALYNFYPGVRVSVRVYSNTCAYLTRHQFVAKDDGQCDGVDQRGTGAHDRERGEVRVAHAVRYDHKTACDTGGRQCILYGRGM